MFTFEFHDEKAKINLAKHKVEFKEAQSAFYDIRGIDFYDESHSDKEDRFNYIGLSDKGRVLFITYTLRGTVYRIINAQRLTKAEIKNYGY